MLSKNPRWIHIKPFLAPKNPLPPLPLLTKAFRQTKSALSHLMSLQGKPICSFYPPVQSMIHSLPIHPPPLPPTHSGTATTFPTFLTTVFPFPPKHQHVPGVCWPVPATFQVAATSVRAWK